MKEDVFLLHLLTKEMLSMRLEVMQERWVAFGVSSPDNPGKMVGSDAAIGLPLDPGSSRNPAKYSTVGEDVGDVFPIASSSQTLQNADVWQENDSTYLVFTKQLQEDSDNDKYHITMTGTNYFFWLTDSNRSLACTIRTPGQEPLPWMQHQRSAFQLWWRKLLWGRTSCSTNCNYRSTSHRRSTRRPGSSGYHDSGPRIIYVLDMQRLPAPASDYRRPPHGLRGDQRDK